MNLLDAAIVLASVGAALGGYRLGLLTRAAAWAGMTLGVVAAARIAPSLNRRFGALDANRALLITAVTLLTGAFLGQMVGQVVGSQLRARTSSPRQARLDKVLGAGSGVVLVAAAVWLLTPTMASVPSWPSRLVEGSLLAHQIDRITPDPPDPLTAASRLVGSQDWAELSAQFAGGLPSGPIPSDGRPPPALDALARAATVLVIHEVCGRGAQEGTGFVAADRLVVTNAHVVAGEGPEPVLVQDSTGRTHRARVVVFDPRRDLAVLRVDDLSAAALPLAERSNRDDTGWVFGHPGGRALAVREFRAGSEIQATVPDIYGQAEVSRRIVPIRAALEKGDSGSALVNRDGAVVGVAFAIAPEGGGGEKDPLAVALTMDTVGPTVAHAVVLGPDAPEVSTGVCIAPG